MIRDDDSSREGTGLARIRSSREDYAALSRIPSGWQRAFVRIRVGSRTLGAAVDTVATGAPELRVDPLLRVDLSLAEGDTVQIEPLEPVACEEVEIAVSSGDWSTENLTNLCRLYLEGQPLAVSQSKRLFRNYTGEPVDVRILRVEPDDSCVFTRDTQIVLTEQQVSQRIRFVDVGGLDREVVILRERIIRPLRAKDFFQSMGIRVPRGILFHGPPGCGKTLLARALSTELGIEPQMIRGPELFAGVYGETEKAIKEVFEKARKEAPALILIDEIDALAPSRQSTRGELERRVVNTLLTQMDGLQDGGDVVVVGTTNEPNLLDQALRRPGRFDFELNIGAPDKTGREEILRIHSKRMPLDDVSMERVAARAHGFSGADLMNLCREAAFKAIQRVHPGESFDEDDQQRLRSIRITDKDFEDALKALRPSALREFAVEAPGDLSWESVGGLGNVKATLVDEIVRVISDPGPFDRMGIRLPRGVLLYGPPGTGKTLLARVIANQAGANFISIRGPEMLSKWFGESEQKIRELFARARQVAPCIVFFDEIDAITAARGQNVTDAGDRIVNQLLTEMDGFQSERRVCVFAATNRKDILDPALLRPGRFDYVFEVPLPGQAERQAIFKIHMKDKPASEDVDLSVLADDSMTKGFSGAHIEEVCRRAALESLRENSFSSEGALISQRHIEVAVQQVANNIENLEKKIRRIGFHTGSET